MATIVKTNFDMGESIILWKENILPDSIHDELIESFKELTWFGGDYEGREVSRKQRWYHIDGSYFCGLRIFRTFRIHALDIGVHIDNIFDRV